MSLNSTRQHSQACHEGAAINTTDVAHLHGVYQWNYHEAPTSGAATLTQDAALHDMQSLEQMAGSMDAAVSIAHDTLDQASPSLYIDGYRDCAAALSNNTQPHAEARSSPGAGLPVLSRDELDRGSGDSAIYNSAVGSPYLYPGSMDSYGEDTGLNQLPRPETYYSNPLGPEPFPQGMQGSRLAYIHSWNGAAAVPRSDLESGYDNNIGQQTDAQYLGTNALTPSVLYTQGPAQNEFEPGPNDVLELAYFSGVGPELSNSAFISDMDMLRPPLITDAELQEFNSWHRRQQAEAEGSTLSVVTDSDMTQSTSAPATLEDLPPNAKPIDLEATETSNRPSYGRPKKARLPSDFKCRQCSRVFVGVWHRVRHEKYVHMMNMTDSDLAELTCPWCQKVFSRQDVLRRHMESVEGILQARGVKKEV
jgi:Zinc finger, C2H2 type